ncbi:hypothetical protein YPC_0753 [Yersinia pestis biovar Medievalis str. Harbin 35]|nr:hypothetical protein YPC_0753 [Yersinia pestis biovar Medievalis str. Harbin 35]EEO75934.1 hypothetical protein YP516_3877 [Yersinia pestis Nepal516]EEO82562.1 hypothetical protein YPF_0531 [Yersinia pestis biovar Orientalis str. India 195]EEO86530.1 hypothetical protein YPH_2448 [Yersinia pestis biovar Orientalis str. PEXU2]EEO92200.1 hypothetical protein YPS_0401 [Yersinia pestis Pestoides A]QOW12540.1 hypothetical protein S96127_0233 [Yersinia pestis]
MSNYISVILDIPYQLWRTEEKNQVTLWAKHHHLSLD